jgi:hypothetical protein
MYRLDMGERYEVAVEGVRGLNSYEDAELLSTFAERFQCEQHGEKVLDEQVRVLRKLKRISPLEAVPKVQDLLDARLKKLKGDPMVLVAMSESEEERLALYQEAKRQTRS